MAKKILAVDDDIITQNMLRSTLSHAGYSVTVASDGEEGIKKAVEEKPDLIILDIMMPGMDGGEVAGFLRTNPETEKIPIIFLSSLITGKGQKIRNKSDITSYLSKPYNRNELLNEIRRLLSGTEIAS